MISTHRVIKLLSVVIPCHNEQEILAQTHKHLSGVLFNLVDKHKCGDYELIYVDNGSSDGTLRVMESIFENDRHAKVISLRRNFGFQGSISAGLANAKGDAVVTIDADLQDPPEKIEDMVDWFLKGYDLVLGVRKDRSSDHFFKKFFAENYYRIIKSLGVEVVYNHGDFRLMAKSLVDEFNNFPERNRFIRAMVLRMESHYAIVHYDRRPRSAGQSKFRINSLISFSLDGITSFSYAPLRLATILGIFMCCVSFLGIFWILYVKVFTSYAIPGWASTLLPILIFNGVQFIVLGIIGEYIGRLYIEVKRRPLYSVRTEFIHDKTKE